jgi:hypothetical protein
MNDPSRRDAVKLAVAGAAALAAPAVLAAEQPSAAAEPKRGSAKLLEELGGKKTAFDMAELKKWVQGLEEHGVHIPYWWTHGIPAIDVIVGRGEAAPKDIGKVVQGLFTELPRQIRPDVDVFPYGIPAVLNLAFQVRIARQ